MNHSTNDGWGDQIKVPQSQCEHTKHVPQYDHAEMRKDGRLSVEEFRAKYPRYQGICEDCGAQVICYASYTHYIMGDW